MTAGRPTYTHLARDRRVAALLHLLDQHRRVLEQRMDLGTADIRLLWLLADERPRTMREISEALSLEQSTVNRQVNAALEHGLVHRSTEPGQAARLVTATSAGRDALERDIDAVMGVFDRALGTLGEDAETFVALLGRFEAAFGAAAVEDETATPTG